jgi:hypothetical protein
MDQTPFLTLALLALAAWITDATVSRIQRNRKRKAVTQ